MKKFSLKYLFPFYIKYGKSFLFNAIVPILCMISTVGGDYFGVEFLFAGLIVSILITIFIVSVCISSTLKYNWNELTVEQKIIVGQTDNTLTFDQQVEWNRLYGNKISTKNVVKS